MPEVCVKVEILVGMEVFVNRKLVLSLPPESARLIRPYTQHSICRDLFGGSLSGTFLSKAWPIFVSVTNTMAEECLKAQEWWATKSVLERSLLGKVHSDLQ